MTDPLLVPVVLAGGSGTRLWPLSREEYPKQLLHLQGSATLLQETVLRLDGLGEEAGGALVRPALVVCNEEHRFLALEQLEQIGRAPATVLLEPASRNTAPALTLAALEATREGVDPMLLVLPSDHAIADVERFHAAVGCAARVAADGAIVTFGIVPTRPETGYGYIRRGRQVHETPPGAHAIDAFVEKPGLDAARSYVDSGRYYWNGGMFLMRASLWLAALDRHRPDVLEACRRAFAERRADGRFVRVSRERFAACPADSIDYAVMERLAGSGVRPAADGREGAPIPAVVVPLDAGWSDVGSWSAVLELGPEEEGGNVLQGDVFADGARGSLVLATSRLVAALGVEDTIVVETSDAVLVAHRDRGQEVRKVVEWLNASGRDESRTHRRVYRPWGSYEQLDAGERFQVKRLTVKPGAALSLQMHHHRAEHWVVVRGTAKVTRGDEEFLLSENESTYIPLGTRHRLENPGAVELEVIEVQSGSYLGEDDIVRFEDRYDRTS